MMRHVLLGTSLIVLSSLPVAASAMTRNDGSIGTGSRAAIVDPDAKLERMAAASSAPGISHAKPRTKARSVLKDDPYLQAAFAWLDNK